MFRGNLISHFKFHRKPFAPQKAFLFPFLANCRYLSGMLKRFPFEALFWLTSLAVLAMLDTDTSHFSICPLKNIGFDFCPGCGLGTAISLLFHGRLQDSFSAHPLGVFTAIVLSYRIIDLTKLYIRYGKSY